MAMIALAMSVIALGASAATAPSVAPPWAPPATPAKPGEIAKLERLLGATAASDPNRPDLMLRLAERCGASPDSAVRDRGLDLLRDLVSNKSYASYGRRDDALFALGVALAGRGDARAARQTFMELIKSYPRSRRIPMAYAHFGDHFFASGAMQNAKRFYDKVLQFPNSRAYIYALYKSGWVAINLADHREALERFFKVYQRARAPAMKRAAADGLVLAYAEVGKPSKAYPFFRRVDRAEASAMQDRLAAMYETAGKWAAAIASYRALISRAPESPKLCRWQAGIARAARAGLSRADAARELLRLRQIGTPECRRLADEISATP